MMSAYSTPSSNRWLFKVTALVFFGLLLLARIGYGQNSHPALQQAIIQGSIHVQSLKPVPQDQTGKVQPGTPVRISVVVENKGTQATPDGEIYVRYAFAKPLDNEPTSVIFQTEKVALPAIEPKKSIEVTFDTPHSWPSLLDFVRYDWSLREYQAIVILDHAEKTIGTLAVTFSAYYYPGIHKEFLVPIETEATTAK